MNTKDAANVVAFLNAAFPHDSLEPESVSVFTSEIALLADAAVALEAARLIAREGARFPLLREFRQTYRSRAEAARTPLPALETDTGPRALPDDVKAYLERIAGSMTMPHERVGMSLPDAEPGSCGDDCSHEGARVNYLGRLLCRTCALSRLRVADSLQAAA